MSVLIKGIEKPKNCGICPFELDGFPDDWEMHCKLLGRQVGYFDKKNKVPKDCPLVEIPTPHGRLIDADELLEIIECLFKDLNSFENFMYNHGVGDSIATIKNAPTIIEAEEGKEDE